MNLAGKNFESEFTFKTSRSGGKGGQNVNKVSSKVALNFDVQNSLFITEEEKERILKNLKNKITKDGILQIVSQTERNQLGNKEIVIKKFFELIRKALTVKKKRKPTKPSKIVKERRLKAKKILSDKKEIRKKSW